MRPFGILTAYPPPLYTSSPRLRALSQPNMKSLQQLAILLIVAGCASSRTVASPVSAPAPAPTPTATTPGPMPAAPPSEPQRNWQLLDETTDGVPGISAERAQRELLANRQPARTVLVAVIDGGIDTSHVDLRANLWTNPKEIFGNGRDDDNNGYVDDLHGWNFIGGRDGKDVHYDTFEVTRLYGWCTGAGTNPGPLPPDEKRHCEDIKAEFKKTRDETQNNVTQINQIDAVLSQILPILRQAVGTDSLTRATVSAIKPANSQVEQAKTIFLRLAAEGITPKDVAEAKTEYEARLQYALNPAYNPRTIVGDD